MLAFYAGLTVCVSCVEENDGGDDDAKWADYIDQCHDMVHDPVTNCEALCTEKTCKIEMECGNYLDAGSTSDCIDSCNEGCQGGCFPVGMVACIDHFTDCETLNECLTALYQG